MNILICFYFFNVIFCIYDDRLCIMLCFMVCYTVSVFKFAEANFRARVDFGGYSNIRGSYEFAVERCLIHEFAQSREVTRNVTKKLLSGYRSSVSGHILTVSDNKG